MLMLRIFAILFLLAGVCERATAQTAPAPEAPSPEALGAAQELFSIISPDVTQRLSGQITNMLWPMIEQKARADKIDDATVAELRQEFDRLQIASLTETVKEAPPIYARHFTANELNDIIAFYRTPTGVKALRELPQVMGEFAAVLGHRIQDMQRQSGAILEKILRDHGYSK